MNDYKRMCARSFLYGLLSDYGATDDTTPVLAQLEQSVADDFGYLREYQGRQWLALPNTFFIWRDAAEAVGDQD